MRHRAFTLVELLVVIGIILVLISILLPAINRAHQQAVRTSMMGDFAAISQALDQYRNDWGDYPRTGKGATVGSTLPNTAVTGAATLCWALVAPGPGTQDGAGATTGTDNGAPGFRLHPTAQGKVYGPYISLDRFRIGTIATGNASAPANNTVFPVPTGQSYDDTTCVLADRYGNIILYFPANTQVSPTKTGLVNSWNIGVTPPLAVYNYSDNSTTANAQAGTYPPYLTPNGVNLGQSTLTLKAFAYRLGRTSAFTTNPNGPVNGSEVPVVVPYLLWSAGPDGQFGPQVDTNGVTTGEDDDVVYPDQLLSIPAGQKP